MSARRNIVAIWASRVEALRDINLEIAKGRFVASWVIPRRGENRTFMSMIAGLTGRTPHIT